MGITSDRSGTLWSDQSSEEANDSAYYKLLTHELEKAGVVRCASASQSIRVQIEERGNSGLQKLRHLNCPTIQSPAAARRFGWGSLFTEFLIAPGHLPDTHLCSLGALSNLMIVTCDDLLDSGVPVSDVLPEHQLQSGGDASAVMLLLLEYWRTVHGLALPPRAHRTMKKVIANMFDAEVRTVTSAKDLPYRFWLRKCSLPLALMALPALSSHDPQIHLTWIYRVGRFLGVLDDALDYTNDVLHCQPNCLLSLSESERISLLYKAAAWGLTCLLEWDRLVPSTCQTALAREAFLQTIWGW